MSILKKIFFLSIFIFFLSLLFWGIYTLSFKKTEVAENENAPTDNNSIIDSALDKIIPTSNAKISVISQEALISPLISTDEDKIWYFSTSGELKEFDLAGSAQKNLADKKITGVSKVVWSPNKLKALLKIKNSDGSSSFSLFDIKTGQASPLNANINEVSWLATSDKIFYKYFDTKNKKSTLNISSPDGSGWKKLLELPHDKIFFYQIPRSGLVSVWNNGDAYYPTLLQTISLIGEDLKTLYKDSFGADYLWDNAGNHALVSQTDTKGGTKIQLGVINYNGGEYKNLGLPTFAFKCLWSKDNITIYCALPGEIPDNSILPNDYKAGKFTTSDTFWKINIETGEKKRLVETADINSAFDASNLFANSDESLLFFVNKIDGKLYKIAL
ncbi:MAG TPA: hypothetical protein P5232_02395 [Candidatus Moranbacteria bacterium]|nr:hypothetical protein [Candidatus Moranbacteria bacterium]